MSLIIVSFPYNPWIRCPHCGHEFHLYSEKGAGRREAIVEKGSLFACPSCTEVFSLTPLQYVTAGAKPWPWWVFLFLVLFIMGAMYGGLCLVFMRG